MAAVMRPFNPTPDLLDDALAVNEFLGKGQPALDQLTSRFGLTEDAEGATQLNVALSAYAWGEYPLAVNAFLAMAKNENRLASLARVFEALYKAVNGGFDEAAPHWVRLATGLYSEHAGAPEAQRLVLEYFTYFGLWDHALSVLGQLPPQPYAAWRRHVMLARARAEGFKPQKRFTLAVLTWNRADLLDRCLGSIRERCGTDDLEILVGVNASSDHTRQVLDKHGVSRVFWNARNDSIDYYRTLFAEARGETLIEIDDNVIEFPQDFPMLLERHLAAFPQHGYIALQPVRLELASGIRARMDAVADEKYRVLRNGGMELFVGPTWGCCAAIKTRDWLDFGGFYGLRMSKTLGEEPQIIRKLRMRGRSAGMIRSETVVKAY